MEQGESISPQYQQTTETIVIANTPLKDDENVTKSTNEVTENSMSWSELHDGIIKKLFPNTTDGIIATEWYSIAEKYSTEISSLNLRSDWHEIVSKIPPNELWLAVFVAKINDMPKDDLKTIYQELPIGNYVKQLEDFDESYETSFEENIQKTYKTGLSKLDELGGTEINEDGVNVIKLNGQPFNLLIHEINRIIKNKIDQTRIYDITGQIIENPELQNNPEFYYSNFTGREQLSDSNGDWNSISTSLITDKRIETWGGMSNDNTGNSAITFVYNEIPLENIKEAYLRDAGTANNIDKDQKESRIISEKFIDFNELKSRYEGERILRKIPNYNEVLLSRQRITHEPTSNGGLKEVVHRNEFIKPTAVLLPITTDSEKHGNDYEQRISDTYSVAKKLNIPIIELNLDNYDRQVVPYSRQIVTDRLNISPSQAAQEFYKNVLYT